MKSGENSRLHGRRLKKLNQIPSGEQVELEYPEYLLHGTPQFCFESEIGQEQIDAKRDPYLGQDRIGRSSEEGLDLQVLLDPLEEQLDLPAFFINLGDFSGLQMVRVGDEPVVDAGFRVGEGHQAQRLLHQAATKNGCPTIEVGAAVRVMGFLASLRRPPAAFLPRQGQYRPGRGQSRQRVGPWPRR